MKKFIMVLFILILSTSLLLGCGSENVDEKPVLSESTTDFEFIDNQLNLKKDEIYEIRWSSDNKFVAYVLGDSLSMYGQLYIWEVGGEEPEMVGNVEDRICELILSPNNEYLLVDIGTSVQRFGVVVSNIEKKKIGEINYIGNAFWTNDSNYLIVGVVSDIKPSIEIELEGTVDIASYNIKTGEINFIEKGTAEYNFYPVEVREDGTVVYKKSYFDNQIDEETFEYKIN
ncbi:MAG: hypothetical protein AB7V16_04550 [Vulcanibacillus sp.]